LTLFLQTLSLGLLLGSVLALAASGLTLIFGVMNVINIAHGALLVLASFITYTLWTATGLDPLLLTVVTTPIMFVFGLVLYLLTLGRVREAGPSMTVILTFAIAIVLEGLMGFIWGNTAHSVTPSYFTESFRIGGLYFPKAQIFGAAAAVAVLALLYLMLTKTWLGRAISAASVNPSSARLVGINIGVVTALAFAIGVATTGAGGSIISVLFPFLPGTHVIWITRVLGVVVLGGMGSLPGALIGAILLGVAETMTSTYIAIEWATTVPYLMLFAVLLFRPEGIMGMKLRGDA
jgi:branched-chain amino acid transport system permease protein